MITRRILPVLLCSLIYFIPSSNIKAQYLIDSTYIDTAIFLSGLDIPWEMKLGPDGYIYFTERYGRISRFHADTPGVQHVLADISNSVLQVGAAGLLGLALHPNFLDTPYLYVIYNYDVDSSTLYMNQRLVRYEFNGTGLVNPVTLMDSISSSFFVSGSRLLIGPDRKLYFTTGCTQDFDQAQNIQSNAGKVLRINLDGSIPSDNPYPGNPLWSLGHRNAQGLCFHDGILYLTEHGPHNDDEVHIIEAGMNYGWPNVEGYCDQPDELQFCIDSAVQEPIHSYITPTIGISEIVYYEGNTIPEFKNSLLHLSLKNQTLYQLKLDSSGTQVLYIKEFLHYEFGRLRDILLMPDGRIFLMGQPPQNDAFNHFIFELTPAGKPLCNTPQNPDTALSQDTVTFSWDAVPGATQYELRAKVLPTGVYQKFTFPAGITSTTFYNVPQGYYGWQILAHCGAERSPASVMEIFVIGEVTPPATCPIPDPPFTNSITRYSARLNWDPVEDVQTHILRGGYANTNTDSWLYINTKSTANFYIANDLTPGITYQWQVRAVCDSVEGDTSEWSIVGTFTTLDCKSPNPIRSTVLSTNSTRLSWSSVANAVSYEVWGKNTANPNIVKLNFSSNDTSYIVNSLLPGNTYVWSIFTHCDSTNKLISNFVYPIDTFTTLPLSPEKTIPNSFPGDVMIIPNPNNGLFSIISSFNKGSVLRLKIYDRLGGIVYEIAESFKDKNLDLRHLAKGVYILSIENGDLIRKEKIVIQ